MTDIEIGVRVEWHDHFADQFRSGTVRYVDPQTRYAMVHLDTGKYAYPKVDVLHREPAVTELTERLEATMDEVRSVSSTGGEKGTKLARYDLIPVGPLRQLAEHFGKNCSKYEDRNWERGYEWSKSYAALQRHANLFWGGEDIDPENGSRHLIAVAWHALALVEWAESHPEFDDRPSSNEATSWEAR